MEDEKSARCRAEERRDLQRKRNASDQHTTERSPPEANAVFEDEGDRCSWTRKGGRSAGMMEAMLVMDDEQTESNVEDVKKQLPDPDD